MKKNPQDKPRQIRIPTHPLFRWLFCSAHVMIPAIAAWIAVAHVWWHVQLSWEFLALVGAGLLPFILPLSAVYVGKAFGLELNEYGRSSTVGRRAARASEETVPTTVPLPQIIAKAVDLYARTAKKSPQPLPTDFPDPKALTTDEMKMLATLWKYQDEFLKAGRLDFWCFSIGSGAHDFPSFVRGFSSLAQRGLVQQDQRGMVFLTERGVTYCSINSDALAAQPRWTEFIPAPDESSEVPLER